MEWYQSKSRDETSRYRAECGIETEWAYFKHNHAKGINVGSLSTVSGWNTSVLCAENLRCYPSNVGLDRLGASLVTQDSFKPVVRDASEPIAIHQNIML